MTMERVNRVLDNPVYENYMLKIQQAEKERKYCRHAYEHGLNVARIANVYLLENDETTFSREVVYAAGLLHDIGRWQEYETGRDHAISSAELAKPILQDAGFSSEEIDTIITGIREHRQNPEIPLSTLGRALALADDWARDCRHCAAQDSCYKYEDSMSRITY